MKKYPVKILTKDDLVEYKTIRLELLQKEAVNFGSSFEEEVLFEDAVWIERLSKKHIIVLGSYIDGDLAGILLVVKNPRKKMLHVATINSMYIKEQYRGLGIGCGLMEKAILLSKEAKVEILNLSVVKTNSSAITLYQKYGFKVYGEEKKAIKYNNQYIDLLLMTKEL